MPRRKALHHHRPAVGPASRRFVVLPFAQPTAFTVGCGLARRSVSSPGTTGSVFFWRRTTPVPHARSGSAATATRCSPREPTFGTRATMCCGGLEKSVRERRRMGYTWPEFWTVRGRSSSFFPGALHDPAGAVRGFWCLQVHVASTFSRGVQLNVGDSRGVAVSS